MVKLIRDTLTFQAFLLSFVRWDQRAAFSVGPVSLTTEASCFLVLPSVNDEIFHSGIWESA